MALMATITAAYAGDADAIFAEALRFDELQAAMKGFATYRGFPPGAVATQGETYVVDIRLWHLFPVTAHTIYVERLDFAARVMQSRERHRGVTHWDHRLSVQPDGDGAEAGRVLWTDEVVIDAGWQTPMIARFAAYTYRYSHRARRALSLTCSIRGA